MDITTIFTFIPKLAAIVLVVLGGLIIIEIRSMMKRKEISEETTPEENVVVSLQFPRTSVTERSTKTKTYRGKTVIILFTTLSIITALLFTGVYFAPNIKNLSTATTISKPRFTVLIYQVDTNGTWQPLSPNQLKTIAPGAKIKITLSSPEIIRKAQFTINDEILHSDPQLSPFGKPFVTYTIKEGVTNYRIAVTIQE